MIKKTFGCRKTILATLIVLFLSGSCWALKPERNSTNRILLRVEHPHDGLRVCYTAVVLGAEMWWWHYYSYIIKYCTPNSPLFYATLPGYGYTLVTATKLANILFYDQELAQRGYTTTLRDKLVTAMQNDRRYGAEKQVGDCWDPIYDWKWRSVYMEHRLSHGHFGGNCWGTADYMTRGWEWVWAYPQTSISSGVFPCMTLAGWKDVDVPYYFDREFKKPEFGYAGQIKIISPRVIFGDYLNCFDVIRLAMRRAPRDTDLIITANNTQLNLGTTIHGEAYLFSDRAGKAWIFHQRVFCGPPAIIQVDLSAGDYPLWDTIYALFYHKYTNKAVMTNTWEENWAHVSPVE